MSYRMPYPDPFLVIPVVGLCVGLILDWILGWITGVFELSREGSMLMKGMILFSSLILLALWFPKRTYISFLLLIVIIPTAVGFFSSLWMPWMTEETMVGVALLVSVSLTTLHKPVQRIRTKLQEKKK